MIYCLRRNAKYHCNAIMNTLMQVPHGDTRHFYGWYEYVGEVKLPVLGLLPDNGW